MKKILLPTDFSKNSINAIDYASQLFKEIPCKFYLLNVFKIPYLANEELMDQNVAELAALEEEMFDNSKQEMEKLLETLPSNTYHEFETISDYNLFNLAVHQVVEEKDEIQRILLTCWILYRENRQETERLRQCSCPYFWRIGTLYLEPSEESERRLEGKHV